MALEDEVQYEDEKTTIIATHAPIGVLGAISPWNFPVILSSIKVVSALATGNCVIIKPSPFTPYALLKLCEVAQSVLPAGVFQALNGGADLGERITLHAGIDHVSFTGTIAVGRRILENCARTFKRAILELAGNDAAIVCDDVDVARVVPLVAAGALTHAGQVCVAAKRVYVHEAVYDRFLALLVEEVEKYAGHDDPAVPTPCGPISNKANYDRLRGILDDCRKNNHSIVAGGEVRSDKKGFWITPTVVSKPPEDSFLVSEEQFGKPPFPRYQFILENPLSSTLASHSTTNPLTTRTLTCSIAIRPYHPPPQLVGRGRRDRAGQQPRQCRSGRERVDGGWGAGAAHRTPAGGRQRLDQPARTAAPG